LHLEIDHGITRPGKLKFLLAWSGKLYQSGFIANTDADLFYLWLHGKYIDRNAQAFARTQYPGYGGQYHERLFHFTGLFGMPVCHAIAGYDHSAHGAYIIGQLNGVGGFLPFFQDKRPQMDYYRFEAHRSRHRPYYAGGIAPNTEDTAHRGRIGPQDHIVHIPGFDPQGFPGKKCLPGGRCFVPGQIK